MDDVDEEFLREAVSLGSEATTSFVEDGTC